jgi:hypothetical protein
MLFPRRTTIFLFGYALRGLFRAPTHRSANTQLPSTHCASSLASRSEICGAGGIAAALAAIEIPSVGVPDGATVGLGAQRPPPRASPATPPRQANINREK